MILTRRSLTAALLATTSLTACANFQQGTSLTLAQVKQYADEFIPMLEAGAKVYVADPAAKAVQAVQQVIDDLPGLKTAIDSSTTEATIYGYLEELVAFAQQLEPMILPYLGAAGPLVALGIAVFQAFLQAKPLPQPAPTPGEFQMARQRIVAGHPRVFRQEAR